MQPAPLQFVDPSPDFVLGFDPMERIFRTHERVLLAGHMVERHVKDDVGPKYSVYLNYARRAVGNKRTKTKPSFMVLQAGPHYTIVGLPFGRYVPLRSEGLQASEDLHALLLFLATQPENWAGFRIRRFLRARR
jgi:hypothetical protein